MQLAVVVVSYNVQELLRECLRSLYASLERTPELAAAVWVVDNASADGSAAMVRAEFPQTHLLACPENLGYSTANNVALQLLGFQPAAGEARPLSAYRWATDLPQPAGWPRYVWLLNPDTVVQEDAPARLAAFLEENPRAGACGPRLLYPDGQHQHGAFHFPGLAQTALDLFPPPGRLNAALLDSRLNGRYPRRLMEQGAAFPVDFVLGAALMVRGAAIRQVGLLDESYFMYCEEMDWQQRLARAGWEVHCLPSARVVHYGGASSGQFRAATTTALWESRLRYFHRYHGPPFNRLLRGLVRAGMSAEARRARRSAPPDLDERLRAYDAIARSAEHRP